MSNVRKPIDSERIIGEFETEGGFISGAPYGNGHINDTYLVNLGTKRYILQRINTSIFKDVDRLMENIEGVTRFIAGKEALAGASPDSSLRVIKTKSGKPYFRDADGSCYRVYNFISDGVSIESGAGAEELYLAAKGFGRFQKLLDGYPAASLHETIPNFHDTGKRFQNFADAVSKDVCGRLDGAREEAYFFFARKSYTSVVTDALASGELPLRVTHNDTKINNVLIDVAAKRISAVIDLDTVMPGSVLYDFGDGIRSGATTGAEDERDLDKVNFSLPLFRAYAGGFMEEAGARLTPKEAELLPFGAILMTYECGMRFLTDYLQGDVYFRTAREGHNLDRARTQIKLVRGMENSLGEMKNIIEALRR